jgi:hypothetical protein
VREIPLTQGMVALVDDADFERVSAYRWIYHRPSHSRAGYAQTTVRLEKGRGGRSKNPRMHQLIYGPVPPGMTIDHIDGDGLNNQRRNLRVASRAEQCWNRRPRSESKTGFKGVFPASPGRWIARIRCQSGQWYLGTFSSPEEAARAYDAKARELYGDFAYLNSPRNPVTP